MDEIKNKKLLIVDDEPGLLTLIENILRKEGFFRILKAATMAQAQSILHSETVHCCILDVMLPDGDGFSLLREIRRTQNLPVLFLSARGEDEDRLLGLGLGADDYIVKPFLPKELVLRLCAVLNRVYAPSPLQAETSFSLGERNINFSTGLVSGNGFQKSLTAKEYILLKKLYENKNRIITNDALCEAAWGDGYYGYENTLMVHIRRLRQKIETTPSSPQHLITVKGLGYKLIVTDP